MIIIFYIPIALNITASDGHHFIRITIKPFLAHISNSIHLIEHNRIKIDFVQAGNMTDYPTLFEFPVLISHYSIMLRRSYSISMLPGS